MTPDLFASIAEKKAGMAKSASANAAWIAFRLHDLATWVWRADGGGGEFKMEFFRYWCEKRGFIPTNHHAWGALTAAAVRAGIIKWTGRYAEASSKKTHAHPVKVWKPKGA